MKIVIPNLLYASPPLSREALNDIVPVLNGGLIVNLCDLNLRYKEWLDDMEDVFVHYHDLVLPLNGEVYEDRGRAPNDKNKTIKKLCEKIVIDYLKKDLFVLIICRDGTTNSAYIAMMCKWWYDGDIKKDVIKELRDNLDFTTCKSKFQRNQFSAVKEYASSIIKWQKMENKNKRQKV